MALDFSPVSIEKLFTWILRDLKDGEIFGVPKELFFSASKDDPFRFERYGVTLESPIGVAAGPHTQMAQNLILAWLCGARYLELKTVQTLDELNVARPCIDMQDEGYNCEWSQELRLHQSYHEYLNAWIIIHALRHKFGLHDDDNFGCIFNMSVGYNLEGILKDNVQEFLHKMQNCGDDLRERVEILSKHYPAIKDIDIPDCMSDNITLSTMHGCPPDEIEKIARYLIEERKYHTAVKLNPTLLGPEELRHILNEQLGFDTNVPDEAFGHDLKYPDAVKIIKSLTESAQKSGVDFGLKLTNTLESVNHKDVFPTSEKMMYMSGRALHPISINVAKKLQTEFDGQLDISFSAGIDCFNVASAVACGLKPLTVSSDVLKPGGYGKLSQYLEELQAEMESCEASSIDEFIVKRADGQGDVKKAALANLQKYGEEVCEDKAYKRSTKKSETIKTKRNLNLFDCIKAPCVDTCPANQDIPQYLFNIAQGRVDEALEVIMRTNPFPNVLGQVCDHTCMGKCTRINYDQSLLIRELKRYAAETCGQEVALQAKDKCGKSVAIVGAGPSGMACAFFLALEGFDVTVYEAKGFSGGMVSDAIPSFRLTDDAISKDMKYIESFGVKVQYDTTVDEAKFDELRKENDFVYVAVGAQRAKKLMLDGEEKEGVYDCLSFLSDVRRGKKVDLGKKVAIVGGGNSAMDAARTAWRLVGKGGQVIVVYRRTKKQMPADSDEIHALLEEGIDLRELTTPVGLVIKDDRVRGMKLVKMKLGEKDVSGRARPIPIEGSEHELEFDTIIPAIGQDAVVEFMGGRWVEVDEEGCTEYKNVFAGGDAARGASTVVWAVSDGRRAAQGIIKAAGLGKDQGGRAFDKGLQYKDYIIRRSRRIAGTEIPEVSVGERRNFELVHTSLKKEQALREADRCLYCDDLCSICVTVCPNRANKTYEVQLGDYPIMKAIKEGDEVKLSEVGTLPVKQSHQVVNVGNFCNGCGNCTTFCPTSGAPFEGKPTFFLTEERFFEEENGYMLTDEGIRARVDGKMETLTKVGGALVYETETACATLDEKTFAVTEVELKEDTKDFILRHAVEMAIMLSGLATASFK